jgi:hypothetical protein
MSHFAYRAETQKHKNAEMKAMYKGKTVGTRVRAEQWLSQ